MLLEVLQDILREPCHTFLRTKKHLGYGVQCETARIGDGQGLHVFIKDSSKDAEHLNIQIEQFLKEADDDIGKMNDDDFTAHKENIKRRRGSPATPSEQNLKYWLDMQRADRAGFEFDSDDEEKHLLDRITKEQVAKFFQTYLAPGADRVVMKTWYVPPSDPRLEVPY